MRVSRAPFGGSTDETAPRPLLDQGLDPAFDPALDPGLDQAGTACIRLIGSGAGARTTDAAARRLSGQRQFCDKIHNRWRVAARDSLCWRHAITTCATIAIIADSGNHRILLGEAV